MKFFTCSNTGKSKNGLIENLDALALQAQHLPLTLMALVQLPIQKKNILDENNGFNGSSSQFQFCAGAVLRYVTSVPNGRFNPAP